MADVWLSGWANYATTEAERVMVVLVCSPHRNTAFFHSKLRRHLVPRLYIGTYYIDDLIVVWGSGRDCFSNGLLNNFWLYRVVFRSERRRCSSGPRILAGAERWRAMFRVMDIGCIAITIWHYGKVNHLYLLSCASNYLNLGRSCDLWVENGGLLLDVWSRPSQTADAFLRRLTEVSRSRRAMFNVLGILVHHRAIFLIRH